MANKVLPLFPGQAKIKEQDEEALKRISELLPKTLLLRRKILDQLKTLDDSTEELLQLHKCITAKRTRNA